MAHVNQEHYMWACACEELGSCVGMDAGGGGECC
jgi:hypothetical protein